MREGNFFGNRVVLSNAQWQACLRRLDVSNAVAIGEKFFIQAKCPFCTVDGRRCRKCPLGSFKDENYYAYGCLILMNRVGKQDCSLEYRATTYLTLSDENICWRDTDNENAQLILKGLHTRFSKMKRTLRRKW